MKVTSVSTSPTQLIPRKRPAPQNDRGLVATINEEDTSSDDVSETDSYEESDQDKAGSGDDDESIVRLGTSEGRKTIAYGVRGTGQATLRDRVLILLSSIIPDNDVDIPLTATCDEIAMVLTAKHLWAPRLVALFQHYPVTTIHITTTEGAPHELNKTTTALVQQFFVQRTFTTLTDLILAGLPLKASDICNLSLLQNVTSLDLTNTGLDIGGVSALVYLRNTLRTLNLTGNIRVDDKARNPLRLISALTKLYLEGTAFTMDGLRKLVKESKRRLSLPSNDPQVGSADEPIHLASIPIACVTYFLSPPQYALYIPKDQAYITDPEGVDESKLAIRALERNLELHAKVDLLIPVRGMKMELVYCLRDLLYRRSLDGLVKQSMAGNSQEVEVGWWLGVGMQ
ncbi:hypothetical protein BGX38DRAFT_384545 [Terfezia claveryi]|nr:hypothetical protein BGX38DRAFT_581356 [Terfezia claveryi]KAF8430581.1 hypothetical protein BGX38DRAFT_384545 [Terfezia claveryi]